MIHQKMGSQKVPPDVEEPQQQDDMDDIDYLSGKPFFDVVLTKTNVSPHYNMLFPARIPHNLPSADVPAVLSYNHKDWEMTYLGGSSSWPKLDKNWKKFVVDNNLAVGDACVFEVMDSNHTKVTFKVHVMKNDLPPELLAEMDYCGTAENPICLD